MLVAAWLVGCNGDKDTTPTDHSATTEDTGPTEVVDLFTQSMITPVDILWVLDGDAGLSGDLTDAIEPMWETLLLADPSWQMGVLDANATGARYALISKIWSTWPPPNNAFAIGAPTASARFDETVYSALELREASPSNKDFLRSGASLYTIYVAGSEDASNEETISRRDFLAWYEGLREDSHIAVITDRDGRRYWEDRTVRASMFEVGNNEKVQIREALLEAIGLETSFTLTSSPLAPPESVEVIYRDHADVYELETDYAFDPASNTLSFKKVIPPPDSIVRVIYQVATGTTPSTAE
jgi:hypothetical protein